MLHKTLNILLIQIAFNRQTLSCLGCQILQTVRVKCYSWRSWFYYNCKFQVISKNYQISLSSKNRWKDQRNRRVVSTMEHILLNNAYFLPWFIFFCFGLHTGVPLSFTAIFSFNSPGVFELSTEPPVFLLKTLMGIFHNLDSSAYSASNRLSESFNIYIYIFFFRLTSKCYTTYEFTEKISFFP